ncbi:MAG: hypothetical protein ACOYJ1_08995 [Peptococcales bacterium]|jgi:hypothetical protein
MYFIAITNWKRKIIYLVAVLLIIALVGIIVPQILSFNTVETDSQINDDEVLTQPLKVQGSPDLNNPLEITPQK